MSCLQIKDLELITLRTWPYDEINYIEELRKTFPETLTFKHRHVFTDNDLNTDISTI